MSSGMHDQLSTKLNCAIVIFFVNYLLFNFLFSASLCVHFDLFNATATNELDAYLWKGRIRVHFTAFPNVCGPTTYVVQIVKRYFDKSHSERVYEKRIPDHEQISFNSKSGQALYRVNFPLLDVTIGDDVVLFDERYHDSKAYHVQSYVAERLKL